MIKWDSFQGCKDGLRSTIQSMWYITLTKMKDKKSYEYLDRCKRAIDKIQHPFMMNTLNKMGIEGTYLNKGQIWQTHIE